MLVTCGESPVAYAATEEKHACSRQHLPKKQGSTCQWSLTPSDKVWQHSPKKSDTICQSLTTISREVWHHLQNLTGLSKEVWHHLTKSDIAFQRSDTICQSLTALSKEVRDYLPNKSDRTHQRSLTALAKEVWHNLPRRSHSLTALAKVRHHLPEKSDRTCQKVWNIYLWSLTALAKQVWQQIINDSNSGQSQTRLQPAWAPMKSDWHRIDQSLTCSWGCVWSFLHRWCPARPARWGWGRGAGGCESELPQWAWGSWPRRAVGSDTPAKEREERRASQWCTGQKVYSKTVPFNL